MALSGTKTFNPNIEEIMEEAYERAGSELRSGNDFRSARRSLEYLLLEWQNKGLNLWMIEEGSIASSVITKGTIQYNLPQDVISLKDVWMRLDSGTSNQVDYHMERISHSTYSKLTNKLLQGRPTQYFFQRIGIRDITSSTDQAPNVKLWPVPDATSKYTLVFHKVARMDDAGVDAINTVEIPERFLPALVAGLAYHVAMKSATASETRVMGLNATYNQILKEAMEEDRVKADLIIVPDLTGYSP